MEPANGCRICMTILSGSGKAPWVWSTEGSLVATLWSPPATPRHPTTGQGKIRPARDTKGIERYLGVRRQRLHIGRRRRRTMASIRPGPNLRKGTSDEGENSGGLHYRTQNGFKQVRNAGSDWSGA